MGSPLGIRFLVAGVLNLAVEGQAPTARPVAEVDGLNISAPPRREGGHQIAVVGAGIAGLGCAWLLSKQHKVTVYEAASRLGGHSHTVDVTLAGRSIAVDTGFIVYNDVNYPNLINLFEYLDVPTEPSDMSFSVSLDSGKFEYASLRLPTGPPILSACKSLAGPQFLRMLVDIVRFYRHALRVQESGEARGMTVSRLAGTGWILENLLVSPYSPDGLGDLVDACRSDPGIRRDEFHQILR